MSNVNTTSDVVEVDAVVIGTGFAGIYSIHKLRNELGLSVQAFDNASGVGGTWYWNRYPGARSDTEVNAYCYSFDPQLFHDWKWTERYPKQPEILAYLNHVVDRYDLRRSIQFDTQIESATWDDASSRWEVVTNQGQRFRAQFLIEGVGLLSSTNFPAFPGQEKFKGEIHHTSRWPHEQVDLAGKRVGVIGTGSSGVQVISEIGSIVDHLTVFQRTPQYVIPSMHRPISQDLLKSIEEDYDGYWRGVLNSNTAFAIPEPDIAGEDLTEAERLATFEEAWNNGGGFAYMLALNDVITSLTTNHSACEFIRGKIKEIVKDPDLAKKLTPWELYARRPLCCDGYYETYNRENVELVDVKSHPIVEITETGVKTTNGEYELDVIVFATGFDGVSGNYLKIRQTGRDGLELQDHWKDRPRTHLGLMTSGFPNMFTIFGPNGPFTNQPPVHEYQVDWVASAIQYVRTTGQESIEPTPEAENGWLEMCDEIASGTLIPKVDSWINGSNIPGKPIAVMFYMGGMSGYMEHMEHASDNGFEGFITAGARVTT